MQSGYSKIRSIKQLTMLSTSLLLESCLITVCLNNYLAKISRSHYL